MYRVWFSHRVDFISAAGKAKAFQNGCTCQPSSRSDVSTSLVLSPSKHLRYLTALHRLGKGIEISFSIQDQQFHGFCECLKQRKYKAEARRGLRLQWSDPDFGMNANSFISGSRLYFIKQTEHAKSQPPDQEATAPMLMTHFHPTSQLVGGSPVRL